MHCTLIALHLPARRITETPVVGQPLLLVSKARRLHPHPRHSFQHDDDNQSFQGDEAMRSAPPSSCQQLQDFMALYAPLRASRDSGGIAAPGRGHHLSRDKPDAGKFGGFWPEADFSKRSARMPYCHPAGPMTQVSEMALQ